MKSYRKGLWFNVPGRRAFINITPQVNECLRESGIQEGLCLVNAQHITASVFLSLRSGQASTTTRVACTMITRCGLKRCAAGCTQRRTRRSTRPAHRPGRPKGRLHNRTGEDAYPGRGTEACRRQTWPMRT